MSSNGKKSGDSFVSNVFFIIALIVAFNIFPPLGFLMILWKAGVFKKRTTGKNISSDSRQSIRMDKYSIMTEGRNVESIEYLASAVGVSYETALRDLQKMVSEGKLGPRAYINYVDRTVVINPVRTAQSQTGRQNTSQTAEARPRPSGGAAGSNMVSRAAESDAKKKAGAGIKTSGAGKDAQPFDGLKKFLLIAGAILLGLGGISTLGHLTDLSFWPLRDVLAEAIPSIAMAVGGAGCLVYRGFLKKRENRFKVYAAACAGRDYVEIAELASKTGVSQRKCQKDLEAMLEKGLLTRTAYIDRGEGALVLTPGAGPKAKAQPAPEPEEDSEDRYKAILREIRKLNDDIPDEEVSRRIDEMEDLTGRIFKAVQEKPEKEPQIKSFMSYYLPTTLKLLHSYADFGASGAQGENIRSAQAEIERILDTLVDGFRKQLDKLYETEAMDISSDIDVLETMLRRDGLTGDGSAFNVKTK